MSWLIGLLAAVLLLIVLYWLIVIGEGSYLGPWAVRLIYHFGAGIYDQVRAPITASDPVHLLGPLRVALAAAPDGRVLDVATGTGRLPLLLASQHWFVGQIDALDLSPAMLRQAQARLRAAGLEGRVTLHCRGADHLTWPDASFDLVTCLEALEYFFRPRRAVREMVRLLKPGGTLIISVWTPGTARWLPGKALDGERMAASLRALGCVEIDVRHWQPGHYDLVIARKAVVCRTD